MSDLEASKLAAIQAHAGVRHSDEYIDEAFRLIRGHARRNQAPVRSVAKAIVDVGLRV